MRGDRNTLFPWTFGGFRRNRRRESTKSFFSPAQWSSRIQSSSNLAIRSFSWMRTNAEYAYKAAEADLANLKVQLSNSLMAQKSTRRGY